MIGVPQIRETVLRGLNDQTVIGSMSITKIKIRSSVGVDETYNPLTMRIGKSVVVDWTLKNQSPDFPAEGTMRDLRVSDFYAWAIFYGRFDKPADATTFQLFKSTAERDDAIQKVVAWVKAYQPQTDFAGW